MKPAAFSYHAPASIQEAVELIARYAPEDGRILAGGQTLVPTMAFRMARPAHLIDINGIAELADLTVSGDVVSIGACVRHAAFDGSALPGITGALLRKVVSNIAHYPIRTRGTFCGSVANADPASEWCCVMATLDGQVVARSLRGTRRIAAADFYQGIMTTSLEEDEIIVACELPMLAEGTRAGFVEHSRRKGDFAVAMALVTYRLESGSIAEPRIGIGGAKSTRVASPRLRTACGGKCLARRRLLRLPNWPLPSAIRSRTSTTRSLIGAASCAPWCCGRWRARHDGQDRHHVDYQRDRLRGCRRATADIV